MERVLTEKRRGIIKRTAAFALSLMFSLSACGCAGREAKSTGTPAVSTPTLTEPKVTESTPTETPAPTPAPSPTPEPTPTPDTNTYDDLLTKVGTVFGYINGRTEESLTNIELACAILDGTKIQPGETFSFLTALGPVTEEAGFAVAEVYGGHASEEEDIRCVGGGISMVSSVIYSASLYAVLTPVERVNHTYYLSADSHLRWGCDAYVDAEQDLKIRNDYPFPVLLKLWVDRDSEKVCCEIYGTNPEGLYATPKHSLTSHYMPAPQDHVCDGFWNDMVRDVYNKDGFVRQDDLNYDYDGDGTTEPDYYLRFEADTVWN